MFALRKLLPHTADYDFNVHVMDFLPGQHLSVKEVHYNQHGLFLLQGKGIYRCGGGVGGWGGGGGVHRGTHFHGTSRDVQERYPVQLAGFGTSQDF